MDLNELRTRIVFIHSLKLIRKCRLVEMSISFISFFCFNTFQAETGKVVLTQPAADSTLSLLSCLFVELRGVGLPPSPSSIPGNGSDTTPTYTSHDACLQPARSVCCSSSRLLVFKRKKFPLMGDTNESLTRLTVLLFPPLQKADSKTHPRTCLIWTVLTVF